LIVIGFILVLGLAALSIRYKTVVFAESVLVTDRWFDRTVVVHEDGSFERIDQGRPLTRRMFSSHLVEDHGVRITTTASWRSGTMYVLVKARPFTDEIREARESREPAYTLSLLDRRGFTVYTFNVTLYKMREVTDREGNVTMLEYRVAEALHREDFRAVKTWEMR
jgi:hypothetical protein